MRFMVMVAYGQTAACVTRTKAQAYSWKKQHMHEGVVAWRYHDGSGWADGSDEAWKHIDQLPSVLSNQIYR